MDRPLPLYLQVRERLLRRIAEGELRPGAILPSEFALGEAMGVSQGTARKALDTLEADGLIERRQGRGTFIAEHTPEGALFRFFRFADETGELVLPRTLREEVGACPSPARIAARMGLAAGAPLILVRRVRALQGEPATFEDIYLDAGLLPIAPEDSPLAEALYPLFQQRFGVSISHAEDRLSATGAPEPIARALDLPEGAPVLFVERVAFDLSGRIVEARETWVRTKRTAYQVSLR
ncbi:MAG: GntR family transcriptional regulator [Rubricella sp.]